MLIISCHKSFAIKKIQANLVEAALCLAVYAITISIFIYFWPSYNRGWQWFANYFDLVTEFALAVILTWLAIRIYSETYRSFKAMAVDSNHKWLGFFGEYKVAKKLRDNFDDKLYRAYANIKVPGLINDDIDFLIIGPIGIIITEVKNWTWPLYINNGLWFYINKVRRYFKLTHIQPVQQIQRYQDALVKNYGIPREYISLLIVKIGKAPLKGRNLIVDVINEDEIVSCINKRDRIFSEADIDRVTKLIETRIDPNCVS